MLMINCSKLSGQLLWIWPALRDGGTPLPCCLLCHVVQTGYAMMYSADLLMATASSGLVHTLCMCTMPLQQNRKEASN